MLALPEGEEEKFIAEKSAENNPVEDMTVKQLREEVAKWKGDFEKQKTEVENLFGEIESYKDKITKAEVERDGAKAALKSTSEQAIKLCDENAKLQEELKNQKAIEKLPEDYEPLKAEKAELEVKIAELEKQLQEKPIEVQVPADYETNKKQLAELEEKYKAMEKCAVLVQTFKSITQQIHAIIYSEYLGKALVYFQKTDATSFNQMKTMVNELEDSINEE